MLDILTNWYYNHYKFLDIRSIECPATLTGTSRHINISRYVPHVPQPGWSHGDLDHRELNGRWHIALQMINVYRTWWAPSGCGVGGSSSHYQIACHVRHLFIWCTLNLNSPKSLKPLIESYLLIYGRPGTLIYGRPGTQSSVITTNKIYSFFSLQS